MVDLPISMEEILKNLDAVIVTHTHYDHWDEYAEKLIPKHVPIFKVIPIKNQFKDKDLKMFEL